MYKQKLNQETKNRIKSGDVALLLKHLRLADTALVSDLKKMKGDDIRFLQGASHVIDELIKILETSGQ